MRKLRVFNMVSLDGYICDAHGDMSWAHRDDAEWVKFASENASGEAELLFGRVTYEMMAAYWRGKTMFDGVKDKVGLTLANDQTFSNGNVVLSYEPAG